MELVIAEFFKTFCCWRVFAEKMPGKCTFNPKWLTKEEYKWVRQVKGDLRKALCIVCNKTIALTTMGESALRSHMAGSKHQTSVKSNATTSTVKPYLAKEVCEVQSRISAATVNQEKVDTGTLDKDAPMNIPPPPATNVAPSSGRSVSQFFSRNDVLKSEVLWTLKTISSHCSYNSNENIEKIFRVMFPDSQIAAKFTCGSRKTSYLCVFGLAEYLKEMLMKAVKGYFTILFDESLNKKSQSKQMDIHVRYWEGDKVVTRYFGSQFLGHATANDMVKHFEDSVVNSGLPICNLVQISMDGPNVNWKFFTNMKKKLSDDFDTILINIGSCGLHIVHNSFKTGATAAEWKVEALLSSLYYLFKDSPARREDFLQISGSTRLPLKFVNHRWLENETVCERALELWEDILKYVRAAESKQITKPGNKSYETIVEATKDKLIRAKLQFFKCVAGQIQPFLVTFQSDKPLTPFLSSELCNLLRSLMQRFMKKEVLSEATTADKLVKLDVADKQIHVNYKKIDIGFLTEKALKDSVGASEKQVLEFRLQCKTFLIELLQKLLTKCPASYSLVRNLSALNPREMASDADQSISRFKRVVSQLVNVRRIKESDCDAIIQEYTSFLDNIPAFGSEKFLNFKFSTDRLDELFSTYMNTESYQKLFKVVQLLLVLSHGQASVERGFSVNKELEIENLANQSLMAQRLVCDHLNAVGGVLNVPLTQPLLTSCAGARKRYERYLDQQRQNKKSEEGSRKRKSLLDEIEELKEKKRRMNEDIDSLIKSADNLSEKAESTRDISFVTQSNSLRKTSKEKAEELKNLEKKMEEKLQALKSC